MNQFSGNRIKAIFKGCIDNNLKVQNNGNRSATLDSGSNKLTVEPGGIYNCGSTSANVSFLLPFSFNGLFAENKGNSDLTLVCNGISKEVKAGKKFGWWYEPSYDFSVSASDSFEVTVIG